MPKVELHTHLLRSMRPAIFAELASRRGIRLPVPVSGPAAEPDPSYPLLEISRWEASALVEAEDFARVAHEAFADTATHSNVRHCEMFFEPTLHFEHGVRCGSIADSAAAGAPAAARDSAIGLEDHEFAGSPECFAAAYAKAWQTGLRRWAHSSEHACSAANTVTCLDGVDAAWIDAGARASWTSSTRWPTA